MVLFQAVHLGNSRSEHLSAFAKSPFSNRFLFVVTTGALTIHATALHLPWTQYVLRVEPIELRTWVLAAAIGLSVIVVGEIHKFFRRPRRMSPSSHAPGS
jgi:Ca2+-transporting ATPase